MSMERKENLWFKSSVSPQCWFGYLNDNVYRLGLSVLKEKLEEMHLAETWKNPETAKQHYRTVTTFRR